MKIIIPALLFLSANLQGQRQITDLNANWQFKKGGIESLETFVPIHLPHTYNNQDAFDDEKGYFRGLTTYQKIINTTDLDRSQKHFIKFHGVNQEARLLVNGLEVGKHHGGYTAFVFEMSSYLSFENDTLIVEVNNAPNPAIPPLKGDFTFYGGIYRQVEWINTPSTHFALDQYASDGIFIDPLFVDSTHAKIGLRAFIKNFDPQKHQFKVNLYDQENVLLQTISPQTTNILEGQGKVHFDITEDVHLWSLECPYLYFFECSIIEKVSANLLDQITIPYGLRYFRFDAQEGFFLNGKSIKLIGVNRHQDRVGIGNALSAYHHVQDLGMIKEMGANFLRTAHYPQDQILLDLCDQSGILVSMEIPLDHEISPFVEFNDNCKEMTKEMIFQHYNHPSIIIWAYMNEMGLGKKIKRDSQRMNEVASLAQELEDIVRKEDPYRYTMIPNHGDFSIYHHFGLTRIPMIVGWNLYYGWYEPDFAGFGKFVDHAHQMVPDKPIIISEYGAGADPRLTSFSPERFDFSLDWTLQFHQSHLNQILERPFIAGSAVWNMFDFGSASRQDAVPHINNKGLCGYDRKTKPVFYLYQSHLQKSKVAKLESLPSTVLLSDDGSKRIPVSIITNLDQISLSHNGAVQKYSTIDYISNIDLKLEQGKNILFLEEDDDQQRVYLEAFTSQQYWKEKDVLRVNFGSNFYYTPTDNTSSWFPDSEVPDDFMIRIGGKRFQPRDRGIGSDRAIALSTDDPVYQTMLEDIESLRFSLAKGRYQVLIHLAALHKKPVLLQSIQINGQNIAVKELQPFSAHTISCSVVVTDDLFISFKTERGATFINGIQILKL